MDFKLTGYFWIVVDNFRKSHPRSTEQLVDLVSCEEAILENS